MGFDFESLVDEYISYLQFIKGFSPSYCYTSKYVLRSWFDVTYDLDNFDVDNALDIVDMWFDSKLSDSTINNYISKFSSLFSFLAKQNIVQTNPWKRLKRRNRGRKLPGILSLQQIKSIYDFCWSDSELDAEIKGMILMLLNYGLRFSEVLNIQKRDLDCSAMSIKIRAGKGNKDRIVPLLEEDVFWLKKISLSKRKDDLLFNSQNLSIATIRRRFAFALTNHIGIYNCNPHKLRHTIATILLNNGVSIVTIATLLGHKSIKTTQLYTHLSLSTLQGAYKAALQRNTCQIPSSKKNLSIEV